MRSQTLAGRVWLRETNTTLPWGDDDEADDDSMASCNDAISPSFPSVAMPSRTIYLCEHMHSHFTGGALQLELQVSILVLRSRMV